MESRTFVLTSNYYPPYHVGGACVHVYHLANELAKLGHEVHVFHSLDWYYLKKGKKLPENGYQNHENVVLHPLRSPWGRMTPFLAYTCGYYSPLSKKILEEIRLCNPDIIHHHNITGLGPFILDTPADKRLYTAHDYYLVCEIYSLTKKENKICGKQKNCGICSLRSWKPPQLFRKYWDTKRMTAQLDAIIAPSEFLKRIFLQFSIDEHLIHVIPNFIPEPPEYIPPTLYSDYFLFAGRLESIKGIYPLLEIFRKHHQDIKAKLVIIGSGPLESRIQSYISDNKVSHSILFLGWVTSETLWSLYKGALAVIIPSLWAENCPLVALEALSVGSPVIGSDTGGIPEIIGKIDKNLMASSPDDLVNILKGFDKNRYPYQKIREVYLNNYSAKSYLADYFRLLDGKI
jgi:glycosyltransferase involved in cell wall biosynthesis